MEDHFVYILLSLVHGRYYTGISSSPEQRLNAHNEGINKSTRHGAPWISIWISQQLTKHDALMLEQKIKKRGAKRFLEDTDQPNP